MLVSHGNASSHAELRLTRPRGFLNDHGPDQILGRHSGEAASYRAVSELVLLFDPIVHVAFAQDTQELGKTVKQRVAA
jgi:hypothetical protein